MPGTMVTHPVDSMRHAPEREGGAFAALAWALLGYLVLVVLFGAWVRITGSGAGCGSHWPTCHGEVIPRDPDSATIIEYTHRLTSGVLGIVVLVLGVWAFVRYPGLHRVRIAAVVTVVFTFLEAAIGAGLVLAELVADDDSGARAVVVAIHLVSTFTLTAAAALMAWWARGMRAPRWSETSPSVRRWVLAAFSAVLLVSMAGAVTALGDTLFPVPPTEGGGLLARLRDDLSPAAHFLVRLRIVHPALAAVVGGALVFLPNLLPEERVGGRAAGLLELLRWTVVAQLTVGLTNIWLGAPGWMQIVHLALAQVLWVIVVLAGASALAPERSLVTA